LSFKPKSTIKAEELKLTANKNNNIEIFNAVKVEENKQSDTKKHGLLSSN
jgi:hypothetical protein